MGTNYRVGMSEDFRLFGELQRRAAQGRGKAKMYLEFTTPDLAIQMDEKEIGAEFAKLLETTISQRLLDGKQPDGSPMPGLATATVRRRAYRASQGDRGGAAHGRFKDSAFRSTVARNYRKRFSASKLGYFKPGGYHTFGLESGMLAKSVKAVFEGGHWAIYFAAARGNIERGGSAVQRVFSRVKVWSQAAMQQQDIQEGLRAIARGLLAMRAKKLAGALAETLRNVDDIAEQDGGNA